MASALEEGVKWTYDAKSGAWSKTRVRVMIDGRPFARGSLRACHRAWEVDAQGARSEFVAKFNEVGDDSVCLADVKAQAVAEDLAQDFNREGSGAGAKVAFLPCWALELPQRSCFCCGEPRLQGKYTKHSDNDGGVFGSRAQVAHAFSHFTYAATRGELIVVDIQGVQDYFTDPQIHTARGAESKFGLGNLGAEGISKFLATHRCGAECKRRGLDRPGNGNRKNPLRPPSHAQPPPPRRAGPPVKSAGTVLAERIRADQERSFADIDAQLARQLDRELNHGL